MLFTASQRTMSSFLTRTRHEKAHLSLLGVNIFLYRRLEVFRVKLANSYFSLDVFRHKRTFERLCVLLFVNVEFISSLG